MPGKKKPFRIVTIECPSCKSENNFIMYSEAEGRKLTGEELILELIESGVDSTDLAGMMGISNRQVSRYISNLIREDKIEKTVKYEIKIK